LTRSVSRISPWWEVFGDPTLKGLVEEALAADYDSRIAAARVEQARHAVGVTRARTKGWNFQMKCSPRGLDRELRKADRSTSSC
jgi:hypothetical protein